MAAGGGRLRRTDRLLQSRDFARVAREGRRCASPNFILLVAGPRGASEQAGPRLGVTASRRVGKAVARNRAKRLIREWFRRWRQDVADRVDIVVIARKGAPRLAGAAADQELSHLARRALSGRG